MQSKILVLEKNERVRRVFEKILEYKNLRARFVGTELDCLETFQNSLGSDGRSGFEFVLLENSVLLPNGEKLEKRILERDFQQKIILLPINKATGSLSKQTRDLIEKPFSLVSLLTTMEINQNSSMQEVLA